MALNTSKCNHLTPLHFKGLKRTLEVKNKGHVNCCIDRPFNYYNDKTAVYKPTSYSTVGSVVLIIPVSVLLNKPCGVDVRSFCVLLK